MGKLTDTVIKALKPQAKPYPKADGNGLRLFIFPNGRKAWIYNYTNPNTHKKTNLTIGDYPLISLKRAREIHAEYREVLLVANSG